MFSKKNAKFAKDLKRVQKTRHECLRLQKPGDKGRKMLHVWVHHFFCGFFVVVSMVQQSFVCRYGLEDLFRTFRVFLSLFVRSLSV